MAMTPASPDTGTYGIATTVAGITIESVTTTEAPQTETVPDQMNAVVNEVVYDVRKDLRLTYRGTKLAVTDGIVAFDGTTWVVDSHEEAGTYNGLKRYILAAHRFTNYPAAAAGNGSSV